MNVVPLPDVPRDGDGNVDVDAAVSGLRRLGRVHRLESATGVPGGSGITLLVLARPARPRLVDFVRLADVLPRPPRGVEAEDGVAAARAREVAAGVVLALAYPSQGRGVRVLADSVAAAVAVHDDRAFVAVDDGVPRTHGITTEDVRAALSDRGETPVRPDAPQMQIVRQSVGRRRFCRDVERVLEHIGAGDVYVLNLTRQLTASWRGDVHALYRALRSESPAPHGAAVEMLGGAGLAVLSPETFLRAVGRSVVTRPIKGTRPRHTDPAVDARLAEDLRRSGKERAENTMIVDLERNDLGRVCEVGTVEVPELCVVEGHPTVWQLVSTVRGTLRAGADYAEAIAHCFPGGSVTGAPKRRAMELIDELEPVPRGWYCGAVGWVGRGSMELAVTIRTAVLTSDGTASYGTGSGIVADSYPSSEYEETWAKALPFLRAVNARRPTPTAT